MGEQQIKHVVFNNTNVDVKISISSIKGVRIIAIHSRHRLVHLSDDAIEIDVWSNGNSPLRVVTEPQKEDFVINHYIRMDWNQKI